MITYTILAKPFFSRSVNAPATEKHNHTFWEIVVVLSGSITHVINDNVQTLSANSIMFLRPYKDIHYFIGGDDNYRHRDIYVSVEDMEQWCGYLSDTLFDTLYSAKDPITCSIPSATINHIENSFLSRSFEFSHDTQLYKNLQFTTAITLLTSFQISQLTTATPPWISALIKEMKNPSNFSRPVEELTAETHYSHCHVCREFKKYTNRTIINFFIEQKINYATYLLANTNLKILDVANATGYDSTKNFINQFSKAFHLTPSEWRLRNQIIVKK